MDTQKVDQATGKLEQGDKTKEAYIIDEGVHSSLILPAANPKRHFIYNEGGGAPGGDGRVSVRNRGC